MNQRLMIIYSIEIAVDIIVLISVIVLTVMLRRSKRSDLNDPDITIRDRNGRVWRGESGRTRRIRSIRRNVISFGVPFFIVSTFFIAENINRLGV